MIRWQTTRGREHKRVESGAAKFHELAHVSEFSVPKFLCRSVTIEFDDGTTLKNYPSPQQAIQALQDLIDKVGQVGEGHPTETLIMSCRTAELVEPLWESPWVPPPAVLFWNQTAIASCRCK